MNSSQNELTFGERGLLENEQGQKRGERRGGSGCQNSGILSERTF